MSRKSPIHPVGSADEMRIELPGFAGVRRGVLVSLCLFLPLLGALAWLAFVEAEIGVGFARWVLVGVVGLMAVVAVGVGYAVTVGRRYFPSTIDLRPSNITLTRRAVLSRRRLESVFDWQSVTLESRELRGREVARLRLADPSAPSGAYLAWISTEQRSRILDYVSRQELRLSSS